MIRRVVLLLLVAVLVGCGVGAEQSSTTAPPAGAAQAGSIDRVVDGDTVIVNLDSGARERVRLIGVDTPESVKPDSPVECYGHRASAFTAKLLAEGTRVRLVLDAEARDKYGRLLAYVYRQPDGLFVNAELVREGMAQTLTIPPNVRFADRFKALAARARQAGKGLWSAC